MNNMAKSVVRNSWKRIKLGEAIELKYGFGLSEKNRIHGQIPVYGSSGVIGYHNESAVKGPGIIVGRKGNIGVVYFSFSDFWPIDTTYYIEEKRNCYDLKFLFFLLKTLILVDTAAAVPGLSRESFYNTEAKFPPFPIQQKIASILSAYDDLIEANDRRIKILEEMARLIYKEWFVKFRFPGYEKVKMVESELGMIPEGWEVRSVLDIEGVNLIKAKVKRYDEVKEYFATANVEGNNIIKDGEMVTYDERPSRAQMQPEENTIWFAKMRETFKVICFTLANKKKAEDSILSTGFAGLKVDKDILGFMYFTVNSKKFHILKDQYCTGATQMTSTIEGLSLIKIVFPDKNIVKAYSELTQPMIDQIIRLQQQNNIFRQTRDMLLPKLFSGEIDVSDLDIKLAGKKI
jgi:type I restriction enzyme S subunit